MRKPLLGRQLPKKQAAADHDAGAAEELTLLKAIDGIVTLAEDSALGTSFFDKADRFIGHVAERLGVSRWQAVLLALFTETSAAGGKADLADVAVFAGCNSVLVLQHRDEVDDLVRRGMLRTVKSGPAAASDYMASQAFLDSLTRNEPFRRKSYEGATPVSFFQHFFDITHLRHENELSTELMVEEVRRLMDENSQLPYVEALRSIVAPVMDQVVLTQLCRHLVLSGRPVVSADHLVFLFDGQHHRFDFDHAMSTGTHPLVRMGWVEHACTDGLKDREEYRLTARARETLLRDYDITAVTAESRGCDLLASGSIGCRELFFAPGVKAQIDRLAALLGEARYKDICQRLKERGRRAGFACLFYGAPGTGKTESVLQLARLTGRDIMRVDISQVKSMWVGESERNIKAVFDRYRTAVRLSERTPILLFNEADAVIGKRREGAERSVDKMENTMQNIILQEMESLEGIMVATTNLVQNLDAAFERRFLYKVRFERPAPAERAAIWRSMMPEMSAGEAVRLAGSFDFSGGQIENVARKCDIERILYGDSHVTEERIGQLCREEQLEKGQGNKIGFA